MIRILSFILMAGLFTGCTRPDEAPVFKNLTNVEVTEITGKEAYLNADALFYNPNDIKMKLRKVEVDVEIEGNKVGTISQSVKTVIPANSEFTVPLDATFNIGQMGLLNSIISILGGKKIKVHYTGYIRVTVHGFPMKVPVDYEDEVRI